MESRGKTFLQEIKDAIASVDRLLLIVTPSTVESQYVRDEWGYALSLWKVITPLLRAGGGGVAGGSASLRLLRARLCYGVPEANWHARSMGGARNAVMDAAHALEEMVSHYLRAAPVMTTCGLSS
jgi:TIR domain